jgi:cytochrome c oxidase subunit 1
MTGRMLNERLARWACLVMVVGFNVTFFSMFILGYKGMPRRWAEYPVQFQSLHIVATVGSWILAAGILAMAWNFARSLYRGEAAPANPWGGLTLEWAVPSPPPTENFSEIPTVSDWPYSFGRRGADGG